MIIATRLELIGNITVNEGFVMVARQNNTEAFNGILSPAILNVSGNNTLTGPFAFGTGGNAYNFGSDAGTLTIQSNLPVTTSAERYITFQRAGNIVVNGNISSTADGNNTTLVKYDSGTTTINGPNNERIGHFSIRGGTFALGANAGFSWATAATDTDEFDPRNQAPLGPRARRRGLRSILEQHLMSPPKPAGLTSRKRYKAREPSRVKSTCRVALACGPGQLTSMMDRGCPLPVSTTA